MSKYKKNENKHQTALGEEKICVGQNLIKI